MNAMIFAAGLGTRLMPLTQDKPKAMVLFRDKPLLWYAIQSVVKAGVEKVVVNVHHFPDTIINYINSQNWPIPIVISDERNKLLDTGGGLVNAKHLFIPNKPILVYNADILTSQDLNHLIKHHQTNKNEATLMINKRQGSRYLRFDESMQLCGWINTATKEEITAKKATVLKDYGFCGIQIINYDLISQLDSNEVFSITTGYLNTASSHKIQGWEMAPESKWFDVGSVQKLNDAELNY